LGIFLWRAQRESQFRDEQQRRMTIISDTMADGLYVTDENGVITFFNSATATLLGYEGYELEGSMPRALFYIDRQGHRGIDPRDCPICQVLRTGKSFRGEWKFIRHDDSIFDVEVASQPIFQAHKLVGAVTVFRDVSERNEVKKEMVAAKELAEQASATKSAFLANMSHEIRTPMNGVLGMTAMLQETPLSDIQKDYVQTIRSSGDALLTVIDDILDYSKIEAGMMTIESSPFDIRALFKDVQRLMQFRANQKNLLLSLRVTDAVPQILLGDSVRVRQILLNLIGNAIKFTDQGSVEVLALLTHHEGDLFTIRIEVSDTGIGIAEDKIGRLFKSFSQVDDSTTRRFGGTGLGLSISKRLAELMKGEMGASSTEGQGSVFWFTLLVQAAEGQPVTLTRATETVQNLPPATILLVEDNLVNQKVAAAMLGKLGYKPTIANNGKEALALMQEQDYGLIFMDCQMPVMDGFEATRAIRAGIAGGNTQLTVIALTANAMKEDKDACYAAGMSDYLAKPLQMPLLIAMLKKHLVEVPALTSKL
jgi:PAS domain S-box-containing protein